MKIEKIRSEKWRCGEYTISLSGGRIDKLYPKYYVTGPTDSFHACTLKEAKEKIERLSK